MTARSAYRLTAGSIAFLGQPRVITSHVYPPIADRSHDWCAYFDGEEEAGQYGWGRTEKEAVTDLLDNWELDQ